MFPTAPLLPPAPTCRPVAPACARARVWVRASVGGCVGVCVRAWVLARARACAWVRRCPCERAVCERSFVCACVCVATTPPPALGVERGGAGPHLQSLRRRYRPSCGSQEREVWGGGGYPVDGKKKVAGTHATIEPGGAPVANLVHQVLCAFVCFGVSVGLWQANLSLTL